MQKSDLMFPVVQEPPVALRTPNDREPDAEIIAKFLAMLNGLRPLHASKVGVDRKKATRPSTLLMQ